MKILKNIAILIYRIWYYILMFVSILLLFPFLFISILREEWYPIFFKLARFWAYIILFGMGFTPIIKKGVRFKKGESYMFVANHTSMIDIMLMLFITKDPVVFVGKKELSKIPLFGFIYKRTCILVDRNNSQSRRAVFNSAQQKINLGYSICIFPEGGVPSDESIVLDDFKDGAFRLAIEHKIPIAPVTFHDNKKLFSYTFFSGGPGKMRVMLHPLISTSNYSIEIKKELNKKTRAIILEELENPSF
ncbi:1-acyl-sn-glycerol-3-phosphate acyltransferase [Flavobacteriaceae bacterium]|jgi:1-acyl-sn-glycerol-3-phosphate acyltransferase|nr:1-acyl-sn-glycerol-3-phosphate acyltransferase [Flavobacteriaceae bacterium]MDB9993809.1 1-acyl-sn-glycerol-3-phosphate acyltransferase [Flavobacteriaceae bacterium]